MTKEEIKLLRRKLQLTQQEMAEALKVDRVTVAYWENGTRKPGKKSQIKIDRLKKKREAIE